MSRRDKHAREAGRRFEAMRNLERHTGRNRPVTHDHDRPSLADQRAVLATARAVLASDPPAAHQAAGSGTCQACTVIAAMQLGYALVAQFTGERMFVSEPLRLKLAAAIDATQAELDSSAN